MRYKVVTEEQVYNRIEAPCENSFYEKLADMRRYIKDESKIVSISRWNGILQRWENLVDSRQVGPSPLLCAKCGSLVEDTFAFCSHCGNKVIKVEQ
jgi:hypothetical protein